ncbi:MAG: hydrogenase nickel incorporation protein HypA [Candidatus Bathyarchaeia archaeon]
MHEWALAEAVIAAASEIAEKEGLHSVREVTIKVGELQQLELDIFKFALSQLKPAKFQNAKFKIEIAEAEFKCRVCGHKWLFKKEKLNNDASEAIHFIPEVAHTYVKCPKCGSPDFEILRGRGVWLESIKGVKKGDG